jgi:hypothetical protein
MDLLQIPLLQEAIILDLLFQEDLADLVQEEVPGQVLQDLLLEGDNKKGAKAPFLFNLFLVLDHLIKIHKAPRV